jgi:ubiquinone/menaquinone biosynthesis C-methylase UbiE
MQNLGSKPEGILGRIAGRLMNLIHGGFYKSVLKKELGDAQKLKQSIYVLDVGCGGGRTIGILSAMIKNGKIYGIDHSKEMVRLSQRLNAKNIKIGKVEIGWGDVANLPHKSSQFNLVTAFDTLNYWDDIEKSLMEIFRVSQPGGKFLIINGYPKEGTKWWDFVKFKSENEYKDILEKHRFGNVKTEIVKNRIIVMGEKPVGSFAS